MPLPPNRAPATRLLAGRPSLRSRARFVLLTLLGFLVCLPQPLLARPHEAAAPADTAAVRALSERSRALLYTRPEEALHLGEEALVLARQTAHDPAVARSLKAVGNARFMLERFAEALQAFQQAREHYTAAGDERGAAEALVNIGNVYAQQSNEPRALSHYLDALRTFEELGYQNGVARILRNIGNVHKEQNNLSQALRYYNRSIELLEESGDGAVLAGTLANVGNLFRTQGAYEDAIDYNRRALEIFRAVDDRYGMALAYNNIGVALNQQGRPSDALPPLNKAVAIHKALQTDEYLAYTYDELGKSYLALGRLDSALVFGEQSLALAEEAESIRLLQHVNRTLSRIHAERGDYEQALRYYRQYVAAKDSILNAEKTEIIAQMQAHYEVEEKEQAIELLRQESRIQALQADRWRNRMIAGVGVLFLLSGVLFSRYRMKQRSNRLLATKNKKIEAQHAALERSLAEKNVLLQEVHHRVKNNLQVISSLLNLQADGIDDPSALAALQDTQSRVQAMALIHRRLYRKEDLPRINMQDYIESLSHFLLRTFNGRAEAVHCRVRAQNIHLSADTAVPLGLILNELLSNALEHAFPDGTGGDIQVAMQAIGPHHYELRVADDGTGLALHPSANLPPGLGLQLVKKLAHQLEGTLHIESGAGTRYTLQFKETPS